MIFNVTKKNIITRKERISGPLGLMFKRQPEILCFRFNEERKVMFHMFFVFFPIDIIFLDEKYKVVEIKEKFMPWTVYYTKQKIKYAIEMPAGHVKKKKIEVGDIIFLLHESLLKALNHLKGRKF